jgi:hypothetical protein
MRVLLGKKPDLTLAELRQAMRLDCTLPAIHYVLAKLGLTYKKRHSAPASRIVPTLRGRGARGGGGKPGSIRPLASPPFYLRKMATSAHSQYYYRFFGRR